MKLLSTTLLVFILSANASDVGKWAPFVRSTGVVLSAHYAPENDTECCVIMLRLTNAFAANVSPSGSTNLLLLQFQNSSAGSGVNVTVSRNNTYIDRPEETRVYGRLMTTDNGREFLRVQYLAYRIYDSFDKIKITLLTYPRSPVISLQNKEGYFCSKGAYNVSSVARRLASKVMHYQLTLIHVAVLPVGEEKFVILSFLNPTREKLHISVGNATTVFRSLLLEKLLVRRISTFVATVPASSTIWSVSIRVSSDIERLEAELAIDELTNSGRASLSNGQTLSMVGWRREDISKQGGSVTLSLPSDEEEKGLQLSIGFLPRQLGYLKPGFATEHDCVAGSDRSFGCVMPKETEALTLVSSLAAIVLNTSVATPLKDPHLEAVRTGRYASRSTISQIVVDETESEFGYECLLSENDFSSAFDDARFVNSSRTVTVSGTAKSFKLLNSDCDEACRLKIVALCTAEFGGMAVKI